ncbi:hypothetical protein DFH94DRAFT_849394 [Russula ochroleuca]|uniref:Uncharacterized protein n=1 Tax=Russula ochroleuca TaxID=152965 RepID=A0A9P5N5T7_9AGAM|nr:hypothetical protein DFH94DRAFT_849394 [Russula ochroleuca]
MRSSNLAKAQLLAFYFVLILNASSIFGRAFPKVHVDRLSTLNMLTSCTLSCGVTGISADETGGLLAIGTHLGTSFSISGTGFDISAVGARRPPVEWGISQRHWPVPAAPATSAPVLAFDVAPEASREKWILKATRSAARTRHKPVARIPIPKKSNEPKEAGRGAERLANPNTQGIHHRPLLGPSFQQGCAIEAADGQLIWIEGTLKEESVRHVGSMVQQQQEEAEHEKIQDGHRAFLAGKPTGHVGQFARSSAIYVPTPNSRRGKTSRTTVTPWRRTR